MALASCIDMSVGSLVCTWRCYEPVMGTDSVELLQTHPRCTLHMSFVPVFELDDLERLHSGWRAVNYNHSLGQCSLSQNCLSRGCRLVISSLVE